MPEPAKIDDVTGRPQWTLDDIAAWAGITRRAAESRIYRAAIEPGGRHPGRAGKNYWDPTQVRRLWETKGWSA